MKARLSDVQIRTLARLADGPLTSSEGVSFATVRALERLGLIRLTVAAHWEGGHYGGWKAELAGKATPTRDVISPPFVPAPCPTCGAAPDEKCIRPDGQYRQSWTCVTRTRLTFPNRRAT